MFFWENLAWAADGAEKEFQPISPMWLFFIIFAVFYFLIIRPQSKEQKKHKKRIQELKKGDRVITSGGLFGTILKAEDNAFLLTVNAIDTGKKQDDTVVKVSRAHISSVLDENKGKQKKPTS